VLVSENKTVPSNNAATKAKEEVKLDISNKQNDDKKEVTSKTEKKETVNLPVQHQSFEVNDNKVDTKDTSDKNKESQKLTEDIKASVVTKDASLKTTGVNNTPNKQSDDVVKRIDINNGHKDSNLSKKIQENDNKSHNQYLKNGAKEEKRGACSKCIII